MMESRPIDKLTALRDRIIEARKRSVCVLLLPSEAPLIVGLVDDAIALESERPRTLPARILSLPEQIALWCREEGVPFEEVFARSSHGSFFRGDRIVKVRRAVWLRAVLAGHSTTAIAVACGMPETAHTSIVTATREGRRSAAGATT